MSQRTEAALKKSVNFFDEVKCGRLFVIEGKSFIMPNANDKIQSGKIQIDEWLIVFCIFFVIVDFSTLEARPHGSKFYFNHIVSTARNRDSVTDLSTDPAATWGENDVLKISKQLKKQFEYHRQFLTDNEFSCQSPKASDYLLALQVTGQTEQCLKLSAQCDNLNVPIRDRRFFSQAAQCAQDQIQLKMADAYFQKAIVDQKQLSAELAETILDYAYFKITYADTEAAEKILNLNKNNWNEETLKLFKGVLLTLVKADISPLSNDQVDRFLDYQIRQKTGRLKRKLQSYRLAIAYSGYDFKKSLSLLKLEAGNYENPLLWYQTAYDVLYYGLDKKFAWARFIYDVYDQYSNRWFDFPVENNTFTYTELRSNQCSKTLTSPRQQETLAVLKNDFSLGKLTPTKTLQRLHELFPENSLADVLVFEGSLQALIGESEKAFDVFWKAHQVCRYYDRANWGMTLIKRKLKYEQMQEYSEINSALDKVVQNLKWPEHPEVYFTNWFSLPLDLQKRVIYGARLWLPYTPALAQLKMTAYLKSTFELLSETPGVADLKDQRIDEAGYPNDNRLWDDVRGNGGDTVAADMNEVYFSAHGDYNLLGHEMTHQFQSYLEKVRPDLIQCLEKMFDLATQKKTFPDSYASQNKEEYFAQGVTYSLISETAPKRFGLNRSWVKNNDPVLFRFIQNIEASNGDVSQLACPL